MQVQEPPPTFRFSAWQAGALLLVLAFACDWPALEGGFLWDDNAHITSPALRSLAGLGRIWTDLRATQQYYPLLHSAFWCEHRLWGDAPLGYHLVNVLLHAAAACLLVLVLRSLEVPGALLAGLLFVAHPIGVESVAWISEQKNTLSLVFYLLAALNYIRFDGSRGRPDAIGAYVQASLWFALALLTKTVTATLPAALLVIRWWRHGQLSWKRDVLPLVPWFGIAAASGLLTAWVERKIIGAEGAAFALTFLQRCLLAGRVIWFYLGKILWPSDLIFIYPHWDVKAASAGWIGYLAAVAVVTAALWRLRRRWRGPLAAWLFFVGSLFPALGFFNVFPFTFSYVADHFQYLASIGIITAVAAGTALLLDRARPSIRVAGWGACGTLIATLVGLSFAQSRIYRDARTLYETTLERNPDCWMAENNLGKVLFDLGSSALLPAAIGHFQAALRLKPDFTQAHVNLGAALDETGRPQQAIVEYQEALRLDPRLAEAHYDLGAALGKISGRQNESIAEYREALRLEPDDVAAHNNLGNALVAVGRTEEGILEYEQALRLDPTFADGQNNLGFALALAGRPWEAVAHYQEAVRLKPDFAAAHYNLGAAFRKLPGRLDDAIAEYRKALRLDPNEAAAHNNLGNALVAADRIPEAIGQFEAALRLDPSLADAHHNLGSAFDAAGRTEEAIDQYEAALRLKPDVAETHYNLGIALQETPDRLAEAIAEYRAALRLKPDYVEAHYNLGVALDAQGRTDEAVAEYEAALRLNPALAEAHYNLGAAFASQARYAEAAAQFAAALALQPDNITARRALAAIKARQP